MMTVRWYKLVGKTQCERQMEVLYSRVLLSGFGCVEMSSCNFMLISPYKHHDQHLLESGTLSRRSRDHSIMTSHLRHPLSCPALYVRHLNGKQNKISPVHKDALNR